MKNLLVIFLLLIYSCESPTTEKSDATSQSIETASTETEKIEPLGEPQTVKTTLEETPNPNQNVTESKSDSKPTIVPPAEKAATIESPKKEINTTNPVIQPTPKPVSTPIVEAPKPKEVVTAATPTPKIETPIVEQPKVEKPVEAPKKVEPPIVETPKKITALTHKVFDGLVRKYVSGSGKVNYAGLKNDVSKLDGYLAELEKVKVNDLSGRNEKMAFWINAYNAYTLKLIVKNYPLSSITNLHGGKPWDVKWINLDGKKLSLNNIENDILRPVYKDARIHFAVNCAAKSCPPLLNKAWTAQNLEQNFQTQTKKFVNDANFNKISKKKIEVSKIFEWYADDFGNLVNFLNKYSLTKINTDAKINYVDYDWALNQ